MTFTVYKLNKSHYLYNERVIMYYYIFKCIVPFREEAACNV